MKILALERELTGAVRDQFQLRGKEEAYAAWGRIHREIICEPYFLADQHAAIQELDCASTTEQRAFWRRCRLGVKA